MGYLHDLAAKKITMTASETAVQGLAKVLLEEGSRASPKAAKEAAAKAVGELLATAEGAALQRIVGALANALENWEVRTIAAAALGGLGAATPGPLLQQAAEALKKAYKKEGTEDTAMSLAKLCARAEGDFPRQAFDFFREALLVDVKSYYAAKALGALGAAAQAPLQGEILKALEDALTTHAQHEIETKYAIRALGELGAAAGGEVQAKAADLIIGKLWQGEGPGKNHFVRAAAAETLGMLGTASEEVKQALRKAKESDRDNIRTAAADALKKVEELKTA